MSERKRRFFSGPSLEAALVSAASEYGLAPEEVSYRIVEKRHGFLKVRRNVVIQVDPDSPRKEGGGKKIEIAARTEAGEAAQGRAEKKSAEPSSVAVGPQEPEEPGEAEEPETEEPEAEEPEIEEPEAEELEAEELEAEEPEAEEPEAEESRAEGTGPAIEEDRPPLRPRSRGDRRSVAEATPSVGSGGSGRPEPEDLGNGEERRQGRGGREGSGAPDRQRTADRRPERSPEPGRERDRRPDRKRGREQATARPLARPKRKPREIEPIEERLELARGELAEGALEASEWLLDLVDLDVDPVVYEGEDRLEVELRGTDRDLLVHDEGKVLSALEHLIPRVMRGVCGDSHPVRVDSEGFQERREDRLRERAWEVADKVRVEGQAKILEAMDPADRRIVHLAITDDPEVTTRSLGEGFFKRVKVLPK